MSDLEDSRTTAVGRKRKYEHLLNNNTTGRRSSEGSKESGEISSEDDSDIEEISADQWTKKLKTSTSSSSDSDDDSSSSIEELPRKEEGDTMTRLLDISRDDQKQQTKYFNLTAMSEPVRCLSCGGKGHMAKTCSTRTCSHCQQRDLHPSSACPIWRKCGLCRERGHDAPACRNRSFRGPDPDPCDVCQKTNGHIEEECPRLWSILEQPRKPKAEPIEVIDLESDEEEMPMREGRKPWQLMGAFDDMRD